DVLDDSEGSYYRDLGDERNAYDPDEDEKENGLHRAFSVKSLQPIDYVVDWFSNDKYMVVYSVNPKLMNGRPSSIDNTDLIYDTIGEELHDTLIEGRDYALLAQEVWDQLYSW
ncbi:ubiquitin-specific protease, partial [Ancistrocladus abbreviatus]